MRCFIGFSLEPLALNRVVKLQESLAKSGYRGNFTTKTNIHVTLSFLGEQNDDEINKIKEIMDKVDFIEFFIKMTKITNLKDIIIMEVEKNSELMSLQKHLALKLKEKGFKVEDKEYYPHITLIRKNDIKTNINIDISSVVNKIILFESCRVERDGRSYLEYRTIYESVAK